MEIKCVWWDGYHNAFTDIIKFKNSFFITFRHGKKHHVDGKGEIYIIQSKDLRNWKLIKKFPSLPDNRDPKFFKHKNSIGVLFFSCSDNIEEYRKWVNVYVSYTNDGVNWEELIKIKNYNLCFWRIRNFRNKLYATAYDEKLGKGTYLFSSEDGINFEEVSRIVEGEYANEADLLFEEDGICYVIIRRDNFQTPIWAVSKPPYKNWEKYSLNYIVQGPHIFKFKNVFYIAGRVYIKDRKLLSEKIEGYETKTGILKINLKDKKLIPLKILPSGGDTSYCGSIIDKDKLYLSYYSQHELNFRESKTGENASGIYLLITDKI